MKELLEKTENEKKERSVIVPFVVGGLVGAGIALLLAPKTGREMRADLKNLASKTKEKIATSIDKGRELYQEGTVAFSEAIEAGKAAYVAEKERHLKSA